MEERRREMESMDIIAFTGMPFSGKSEAVQIARKRGMTVIRMGDMVWEETKRQGLTINAVNVGKVANDMRTTAGKDIWAKRTLDAIRALPEDAHSIIIDGIRNTEEMTYLKNTLSSTLIVIAILASDDVRKKRFIHRDRVDDGKDISDFYTRDKREEAWGIRKVIEDADILIDNNASKKDFLEHVTMTLEKLIHEKDAPV